MWPDMQGYICICKEMKQITKINMYAHIYMFVCILNCIHTYMHMYACIYEICVYVHKNKYTFNPINFSLEQNILVVSRQAFILY